LGKGGKEQYRSVPIPPPPHVVVVKEGENQNINAKNLIANART
jgi:hypothetical protein